MRLDNSKLYTMLLANVWKYEYVWWFQHVQRIQIIIMYTYSLVMFHLAYPPVNSQFDPAMSRGLEDCH